MAVCVRCMIDTFIETSSSISLFLKFIPHLTCQIGALIVSIYVESNTWQHQLLFEICLKHLCIAQCCIVLLLIMYLLCFSATSFLFTLFAISDMLYLNGALQEYGCPFLVSRILCQSQLMFQLCIQSLFNYLVVKLVKSLFLERRSSVRQ